MQLFYYVFLLVLAVHWMPAQAGLTAALRREALDEMNTVRRTLSKPVANNMKRLEWDPLLEKVAQNYLDKISAGKTDCNYVYSINKNRNAEYAALGGKNFSNIGELWWSAGLTKSQDWFGVGAAGAWSTYTYGGTCNQMKYYYQTDGCTAINGPYFRQLMLATNGYVGCGYNKICGSVCNFKVEYSGTAPAFSTGGAPASDCPEDAPYNFTGLCSPFPDPQTSAPTIMSTAQPLSDELRQEVLDEHNMARRTLAIPVATNMLKMKYDVFLEITAQNYLNKLEAAVGS